MADCSALSSLMISSRTSVVRSHRSMLPKLPIVTCSVLPVVKSGLTSDTSPTLSMAALMASAMLAFVVELVMLFTPRVVLVGSVYFPVPSS